jgi:hypothetical protein
MFLEVGHYFFLRDFVVHSVSCYQICSTSRSYINSLDLQVLVKTLRNTVLLFQHKLEQTQVLNGVFLFLARQPPVGPGLLIHEDSRSHTTTHHSQ